jgi:hypothetical protein
MAHILLDLDGVCADLHAGVANLLGVKLPAIWPTPGEDLYHAVFGLQDEEIWGRINAVGFEFWANLPKTGLCDPLIKLLLRWRGPVTVFTQLSMTKRGGYEGKLAWCRKVFPTHWQFLCSPRKVAALPNPNSGWLLIDDNDENCTFWAERGGSYVLVPRPWNSSVVREPPLHKDYLVVPDDEILAKISSRIENL